MTYTHRFTLSPMENAPLASLCGPYDSSLLKIEQDYGVKLQRRGHSFTIKGPRPAVEQAVNNLLERYEQYRTTPHFQTKAPVLGSRELIEPLRSRMVSAKTPSQMTYREQLTRYDLNFAIGPAGTGKTYLAIAAAVEALVAQQVSRIILSRPAVEAGEHLGFLPGDLQQKVDPYLRPLYDALYDLLGADQVTDLLEKHRIEIAPLAYMRGRTLDEAFIILDEGQNTTIGQMKMFLTRMGQNSRTVVTGDISQIDLPRGTPSGLSHAVKLLEHHPMIGFTYFSENDVLRHGLVKEIVLAYEADAQKHRD